ncbi:MAG: tetratricopeptide repeat protein [Bacteroidetes bacterium]|nr:tetratricopeptide repeat protein [Bacteroidota bacterium]
MQPDKENINDLEYLASLGYEKITAGEQDLEELRYRVKARTFSYNTGNYFGVISLLTGMFLGISIFFMFYSPKINFNITQREIAVTPKTNKSYAIALDTVKITPDNFVLHSSTTHHHFQTSSQVINSIDTVPVISTIPIEPLVTVPEEINETQVKYIQNAPVIFLHDLKITNYSSLYFRRNNFVKLPVKEGLDPSYSNAEEKGKYDNLLMPKAPYYLHQAIGDAMLLFKQKDYNQCLAALQVILEINPEDINAKFYSGMCRYYRKEYTAATHFYNDCIRDQNNTFLNEALYYKACCLFENGDKTEALESFKQIAAEGSFYSEKSKTYLK